jgi:hypothetical protein
VILKADITETEIYLRAMSVQRPTAETHCAVNDYTTGLINNIFRCGITIPNNPAIHYYSKTTYETDTLTAQDLSN